MSVLEIAEALAKSPDRPKRSILFVWHTGEELGLLGSDWFTHHPTVPRDSIVAQLNIDMIGRGDADDQPGGGPGYVQLIGSRRLSTELGDLVEQVNAEGKHGLAFDYASTPTATPTTATAAATTTCTPASASRSCSSPPAATATTTRSPTRCSTSTTTRWRGWPRWWRTWRVHVADLDHRLVVDKPKPDPEGMCKQ